MNSRIEELIREDRAEGIPEAIADGQFFDMQTLSTALIDLVLSEGVGSETAALAAPNQHDFLLALDSRREGAGRPDARCGGRGRLLRRPRRASAPATGRPPGGRS